MIWIIVSVIGSLGVGLFLGARLPVTRRVEVVPQVSEERLQRAILEILPNWNGPATDFSITSYRSDWRSRIRRALIAASEPVEPSESRPSEVSP